VCDELPVTLQTFTIPSIIPSGIPITAKVNVYDQNNQEVACVAIDITF
jgi:hypothetical protein